MSLSFGGFTTLLTMSKNIIVKHTIFWDKFAPKTTSNNHETTLL